MVKRRITTENIVDIERSLSSYKDLNPVVDLLSYLEDVKVEGRVKHKTLFVLQRTFANLIAQNRVFGQRNVEDSDAVKLTKKWLLDKYVKFILLCGQLLYSPEHSLRITALHISMSLLRTESSYISNKTSPPTPQFAIETFRRIIRALLLENPMIDDVRNEFLDKWPGKCDDIRYFFLKESIQLFSEFDKDHKPRPVNLTPNVLSILERLFTMPTEQSEINEFWIPEMGIMDKPAKDSNIEQSKLDTNDWTVYFDQLAELEKNNQKDEKEKEKDNKKFKSRDTISLSAHRAMYSGCWLTMLKSPFGLSQSENKRSLLVLHQLVIPFLKPSERASLADWLSDCCDSGGVNALLALNSLWRLIRDHNLDYPDFYIRLYALCDQNVLHVLYRARFFRMLDLFLSSTHLPASLVAAFIKRLSRLSISASPSAIVMLIPFTYNLLKRHPGCMHLIHSERPVKGEESDGFKSDERDPMKANALESSLWELASHENHYHASVSRMAQILSQVFSKPNFSMEDFLDHAYASMFETEVKRKLKNPPAIYDGKPVPLFGSLKRKLDNMSDKDDEEKDVIASIETDIVADLFQF